MCLICEGRISEIKKTLRCCSYITEIPVILELKILDCSGCTRLTKISVIPGLKELRCTACDGLTEIPNILGLRELDCSDCTALIKIPTHCGSPGLEVLGCCGCPWLVQNPYNKIPQGLKLQRWIKNNFKYFVFRRWISSQEGREFLYHPDNIGGRIEKAKMMKTLLSLN